MRNVTVAAVQMKCSKSVEKNIAHAEELAVSYTHLDVYKRQIMHMVWI